MILSALDWIIVSAYFAISLAVGIWASKQAGEDTKSFFLAGRNMPWWLLGVSMVATTFSTDTPNLVTDLVRQNSVSGNWVWWAFLLTGMLTVFVYAKLWHRSGVSVENVVATILTPNNHQGILRPARKKDLVSSPACLDAQIPTAKEIAK
jgi:Na+/proline symporter